MMHYLLRAALLSFALLPVKALAENDRGNGGDVVVCRGADGGYQTVRLLDFYEAEASWFIDLEVGTDDLGVTDRVQLLLERLGRVDKQRAARYRQHAEEFFAKDAILWTTNHLRDIPDSQHTSIPRNCAVEQIAYQVEPAFPEERRYTINRPLWEALSLADRAGLVLHELVYREAKELGHVDSVLARYFNVKLASREFAADSTLPWYLELLKTANFNRFAVAGVFFDASASEVYDTGEFRRGRLFDVNAPAVLRFGAQELQFGHEFRPAEGGGDEIDPSSLVLSFHRNGRLENGVIYTPHARLNGRALFAVKHGEVAITSGVNVSFYENGGIRAFSDTVYNSLTIHGVVVKTLPLSVTRFHDNGAFQQFTVKPLAAGASALRLPGSDGQEVSISETCVIHLNRDSLVEAADCGHKR